MNPNHGGEFEPVDELASRIFQACYAITDPGLGRRVVRGLILGASNRALGMETTPTNHYVDCISGECGACETCLGVRPAPGWSWCPVLDYFVRDREGHSPAARAVCDGGNHLPALIGQKART